MLITPQPLKAADLIGPVIELQFISADNGSGRFDMAQVLARVFLAQRQFAKDTTDGLDAPIHFGPFPKDKLIVQNDQFVQYQTPPRSQGLGTMTRIEANDDPIEGVAILQQPGPGLLPDLLMLRVRLPPNQRDLAPIIIKDLLVRQRRDPR